MPPASWQSSVKCWQQTAVFGATPCVQVHAGQPGDENAAHPGAKDGAQLAPHQASSRATGAPLQGGAVPYCGRRSRNILARPSIAFVTKLRSPNTVGEIETGLQSAVARLVEHCNEKPAAFVSQQSTTLSACRATLRLGAVVEKTVAAEYPLHAPWLSW